MSPKTGRCAILFPHGVLFRQEEVEMRKKLIEMDLIECVLGLGPNLFYNSPMEACVVICRNNKPKKRRGKILLINAVNEVTRERSQSYLTGEHIERIAKVYRDYTEEEGFSKIVPRQEIQNKDGNLSIPLYVSSVISTNGIGVNKDESDLIFVLSSWMENSEKIKKELYCLLESYPESKTSTRSEKEGIGIRNHVNVLLPNPDWNDHPIFDRTGWIRHPFGDFAQSVNERVEPATASDEIYVGLEHLNSDDLHIRRWGKGSDVVGTKLRFRKGDIIFGRRRAYQRKLAIAEFDGICSAHAMVVRAKTDKVIPEFLPFLMMSERFMNRAVEISVGSLSPTINWKTLKQEEFDLPPIEQQRQIAEILWTFNKLKAEIFSIIDSTLNLRKSAHNEVFFHGLKKNKNRIPSKNRGRFIFRYQLTHIKFDG